MSDKRNARKGCQVVSQIAYILALLGTFIVVALGIVALARIQMLLSQLSQVQADLRSAADEVEAQQAYMQELDTWTTEFEVFCNDQKTQDAQLETICEQKLRTWTAEFDTFCSDQRIQDIQLKATCQQKLKTWTAEFEKFCSEQKSQDARPKTLCETNPKSDMETAPKVKTDLAALYEAQHESPWEILVITIVALFTLLALIISGLLKRSAVREDFDIPKKEYERGYSEGLKRAVIALDADTSVLRNAIVWLYNYQSGREDSRAAARIFRQFFSRLDAQLDLKPDGKVGDIVRFDPRYYRTRQVGLNPGDEARIIELGWRLGGEVIRKPLVGR